MTTRRHDPRKSHCPLCPAYGTTKGLADHVSTKHADATWPKWKQIAPSNWRLAQENLTMPTATVCAISDYPGCPPWWWSIRTNDSITASGTANSDDEAKIQAWIQWLRAVGENKPNTTKDKS